MTTQLDRKRLYALTETDIALYMEPGILRLARETHQNGGVSEAEVVGATLHATVSAGYEDHSVEIVVEDEHLHTSCSCGTIEEGFCSHIGAVLLTWIHSRDRFGVAEGPDSQEGKASDEFGLLSSAPNYKTEYHELLSQQTIAELRELAQNAGVSIKSTRKDPIIEELAVQLSDLNAIRTQVATLDETQKSLLTYLHLILIPGYGLGAESIVDGFSRHFSVERKSTLHKRIVEMTQRGLLLTFSQRNMVYYSLPQAVRTCLPPHPSLISSYPEDRVSRLQVREASNGGTIQTLYAIWNYIAKNQPRRHAKPAREPVEDEWPQFQGWNHVPSEVSEIARRRPRYYRQANESVTVPVSDYRLDSADRKAIRQQTGCSDEETEFWYVLLEDIGAVSGNPGDRLTLHEERFQRLLSLRPSEQIRLLWHIWVRNHMWSEVDIVLRSSEDIRLRRSLTYTTYKPHNLYREWRAGRHTVLRFLSTVAEDRWISLKEFLQSIFDLSPNLIHMYSDRSVWWFESVRTRKQFGTTFEDWQQSYGRFVLAALQGPLQWLGAVNLGYREDKLEAFRLSAVGSFVLDKRETLIRDERQTTPKDAVRFDEDLTITLIPGVVPPQLHDLLHLIGELENATPERFVYRISADGVLQYLEQGQIIETLIASLSQWCGQTVPAPWQRRLHTWSENYGKLHVYEDITLIELADDYALQELMINTSLRKYIIYQFSRRLVAIRPEAIDVLVEELEKRGYTPRVE